MSYEKHVYPASIPGDLVRLWRDSLGRCGLDVQFHPDLHDVVDWPGGYLPCSVAVRTDSFHGAERYGTAALSAGFELYVVSEPDELAAVLDDYAGQQEDEGDPLPPSLLKTLRRAPAIVGFAHGGFVWSVAEYRVCWFAAATLAQLSGGLLFDEWGDSQQPHGFCRGDKALAIAAQRCETYEASTENQREIWDIPVFQGW